MIAWRSLLLDRRRSYFAKDPVDGKRSDPDLIDCPAVPGDKRAESSFELAQKNMNLSIDEKRRLMDREPGELGLVGQCELFRVKPFDPQL